MKPVILLIIFVLAGILIGNILTYSLQFRVIFRPESLPDDYTFSLPRTFQEVDLTSTGQGRINALWVRDSTHCSPKGVILYFHGNSGTLDRWGPLVVEQFHRYEQDLFIPDYRGYGKSTGAISEHHFFADALAAYDTLRAHYPAERITVYGRSIGSGPASFLAAQRPIRQLILETPFSSMRDLFYTYYPFLPPVFSFRFPFDNTFWLSGVTAPILVLAGDNDPVTPLRCAQRLQHAMKPTDQFLVFPGGNHNNLHQFPEVQNAWQSWLGTSTPRQDQLKNQ